MSDNGEKNSPRRGTLQSWNRLCEEQPSLDLSRTFIGNDRHDPVLR